MNEEIITNLNDRLDRAVEKGKDLLADEELMLRVDELKDVAEETIKKHPIKSVIGGLAIGFIIAKLFSSGD